MKVIIKYLKKTADSKPTPYVTIKSSLSPGDTSYGNNGVLFIVNQSTCVWCEYKVMGEINKGVEVPEGEEVDIYFKCKAGGKCNYPFCGRMCPGNDGFYVAGREDRGY